MKCHNCGNEVHEGETFCRVCAAPIGKINYNDLYRAKIESKPKEKKEEKFSLKKEIALVKNIISDEPVRNSNEPLENKDLIKKDANNRKKATIINFLELGGILLVVWIIIKVILNLLSKL